MSTSSTTDHRPSPTSPARWTARPLGGQPAWRADQLEHFVRQARIAVM